jgi:hypothetical protein
LTTRFAGPASPSPQREEERNRRWDVDGDFALNRFRRLEAALAAGTGKQHVPFSWIRSLADVLGRRGIRPVFVLTPLNTPLVTRYSDGRTPVEQVLTNSHDYVLAELRASGLEFVDLSRALPPECFADAIHTNSVGDDAMASALAGWLRTRLEKVSTEVACNSRR